MVCFIFILIPIGYLLRLASKTAGTRKKMATKCMSAVMIMLISTISSMMIISLGQGARTTPGSNLYELFCISSLVECLLIGCIVYLYDKYVIHGDASKVNFFLYLVFPTFQIIGLKMIATSNDEWVNKGLIFTVLSTLFAVLGDLSILHFFLVYPSSERLKLDREQLENSIEASKSASGLHDAYLAKMNLSKETFNSILNEVTTAVQKSDLPGAMKVIDGYVEKTAGMKSARICENKYANAVLCEKAETCENASIELRCNVKLPEAIAIDPVVLCSAFGNLLDNAIKACRLYSKTNRYIEVSSKLQGDYLIIWVDNSADANSQKEDYMRKHYGKIILQEYATRYNGHFKYAWDKKLEVYSSELALVLGGE